jgi:hypothetical protein
MLFHELFPKTAIILLLLQWLPFPTVQSQIVYTNLQDTVLSYDTGVPGTTDSGTTFYYLDLDQDGTNDFYFKLYYYETWMSPSASELPSWLLTLHPLADNSAISTVELWYGSFAKNIFDGEVIGDNQSFSEVAYIHDLNFNWEPLCVFFEGQSIGLKLVKDDGIHFGWIRIVAYCNANGHISYIQLIECAVHQTPGEYIRAGQKEIFSAVTEKGPDEVWFENRGSKISIQFPAEGQYAIRIYDIRGRIAGQTVVSGNQAECDVSALPSGLFLVTATSAGKTHSFRFFKQTWR